MIKNYNMCEKEALMILDGLYGAVSEIIRNTNNQFLKNDLGFFILRHLKLLLLKHGFEDRKFWADYNGIVLNESDLREFGKKLAKQLWIRIIEDLNSKSTSKKPLSMTTG